MHRPVPEHDRAPRAPARHREPTRSAPGTATSTGCRRRPARAETAWRAPGCRAEAGRPSSRADLTEIVSAGDFGYATPAILLGGTTTMKTRHLLAAAALAAVF